MNRARLLAAVCCLIGAGLPTIAAAQNLEAGKSPGQIFSNTCNECHRSPRGLLRTVPPGSLPGFLREHYTTSREMAQQLSGFLIANGATDTRGRPQDVRQQRVGTEPQQQARPPRQVEQQQQPQQQQAARPAEPEQRPLTRRERRERRAKGLPETPAASETATREPADGRQKNRRSRITPARIEAASERGKDALPLGAVVKTEPAAEPAKPEAPMPSAPAAEAAKPEKPAATIDTPTRADPVPQVTPASPRESSTAPASNAATAEPSKEAAPSEASHSLDDQPSGGIAQPPPTEPPPSAESPPPRPPISQ